ncbi:type II toxin-antitoxin system RelE/ParE family toxin [Dokdonella sp.]|uniref:type II toxin-antitoxin system RelE/ParE family toxin n=1 Tax=Dokdonella sp. TaxID=2291710 RepID=UPI0031CC2320|nr:type II toxin-antitoxin system RelE/ParE family toxin [Dokdonella sp.]
MFEFIELAPFARAREAYGMGDAEFAQLQAALLADPDAGDVIPASAGCRKLRWRTPGRGKRGGYRVIYFLRNAQGQIALVLLYAKNVRENVEPGLLRELKEKFRP